MIVCSALRPVRILAIVILTFLLYLHPSEPLAASADSIRVGRIRITSLDVFTADETQLGWPYRAAAALHHRTRESTIRKFLLFREGDLVDAERLAQTERNLRHQLFIKSASIRTVPTEGQDVDVEVVTQDTWTTEPRVAISRNGGVTTYGFSVLERNLLGTGRKVKFSYDDDVHRIRRFFEFTDPHLFGSYGNAAFVHGFNSDGHDNYLSFTRPFAATTDRWAAGITYENSSLRDRIFSSGSVFSEFRETHRALSFEFAAALEAGSHAASRLAAGFLYTRHEFEAEDGYFAPLIPPDREFAYLYLRAETVRSELAKINFVNRDARFEDFDLGPRLSALVGVSPRQFGLGGTTGLARVEAGAGVHVGDRSLIMGNLSVRSRLGHTAHNLIATGKLDLVHRFGSSFRQTLVGRLEGLYGWDLDPDLQFFADGETGLRAYRLYAYEGNKRILLNLEHRMFLGRELFHVLAPGAAVFFDAGAAVPEGEPISRSDIKSDIGVGLRLGFPRAASHDLLRIDLAYPLAADLEGRRNLLLSFSSRQAF